MKRIIDFFTFVLLIFIISVTSTAKEQDFDMIVEKTLSFEGSRYVEFNVNGRIEKSKYGITEPMLMHYNKLINKDYKTKTLPRDVAIDIYRAVFWYGSKVSMLDHRIGKDVFDFTVHSGQYWSTLYLQKVINDKIRVLKRNGNPRYNYLKEDGILGQNTIRLANELVDRDMILRYKSARICFLRTKNKTGYKRFKKGWLRRVNSI